MRSKPFIELRLLTLYALHLILSAERGRWESPGAFYSITGERLIVDAYGQARRGVDDWKGLKPFRWGVAR